MERGSERRKSEHRKVRMSKVFLKMIRMSKDQNVKNQNVKKNVESVKMTFEVLIFLDAIGNIRTSKIEKINYLWRITYVYQGLWGG